VLSVGGIGRVHIGRWGEGLAHLHWWFIARPQGFAQLASSMNELWDEVLPPTPEDVWRGNVERVCAAIEVAVRECAPELEGWSPWCFAGPEETEARLRAAGFAEARAWLTDRPTTPDDVPTFVRTSILPAHLARLPEERREAFAAAVLERVEPPLDYVRLNVSARR